MAKIISKFSITFNLIYYLFKPVIDDSVRLEVSSPMGHFGSKLEPETDESIALTGHEMQSEGQNHTRLSQQHWVGQVGQKVEITYSQIKLSK